MEEYSDTEICKDICGSKCCRSTPPALTSEDIGRIQSTNESQGIKKIDGKNGAFVIGKKKDSNDCYFLNDDGFCRIYENHPLDCRLFPLFVKINEIDEGKYHVKWLVWYCPLTEKKGVEQLQIEAEEIVKDYISSRPDTLFEYQKAMCESGGYRRKHFLKEEMMKKEKQ